MRQFSAKMGNFDFFSKNCPKIDLGFEIQKTNTGIIIRTLEIPRVPTFRQNKQLSPFQSKFAPSGLWFGN